MNPKYAKRMDVDVIKGRICGYCNSKTKYVDSKVVYYGKSYGMIYLCPECGAYVGTHRNSDKALGRVADSRLRKLKGAAHASFDRLWKCKPKDRMIKSIKNRKDAYKWLSKKLNIPANYTHIGMFDCGMCEDLLQLMKAVEASHAANQKYKDGGRSRE